MIVSGTYTGQLGKAPVTGTFKDKELKLEFKAGEVEEVNYENTFIRHSTITNHLS